MGHRANFVEINDGKATAFEDNWAGMGATYDFALGPEHATKAMKEYSPTDELMDWAFAEAGYLIDHDEKTAIGFGVPFGDDEVFDEDDDVELPEEDPAMSKLQNEDYEGFLQAITECWPGWRLVWDERGVDAFSEYLSRRGINGIQCAESSHPPHTKPPVSVES
jgi:hypothetical protein